jgi:acetate kinase
VRILVINCGSATLKWKLFGFANGRQEMLTAGAVVVEDGYRDAVRCAIETLPVQPEAIAHRIVHGGDLGADPVLVDHAILERLRELSSLAPLHNAPALEGIEATIGVGVPLVAAFDSAFHETLPETARRYAIPTVPGVRRYGFHGWSHRYVTERYAEVAGAPEPTIITLHLGSGCSAAAIHRGRSVDTSMGYSPLEGLIMGTRGGDLDPGVLLRLLHDGMTPADLDRLLNREAGLRALAGTHDMQELLRRTDSAAEFAVELFCYRVRKYVGAYLAVLEGAEAVVFTGGIGERSPEIRRRICDRLGWAGLTLDPTRNLRGDEQISADGSPLAAYAIPTDEERLIAREAAYLLGAHPAGREVPNIAK